MKADPILKELWEIKAEISEECGHDLRRLFDRLQKVQRESDVGSVNRIKPPMRVAEEQAPPYSESAKRSS